MATLYQFPNCHSLSSHKLFTSSPILLQVSQTNLPIKQSYNSTRIYVSSSIKPHLRVSRKGKSNEELCNDIREFLSSVGLPQNHVPYIKELSQYGRQDLANIVRRRGYKFIRQLLEIPSDDKIDTCPTEELEVIAESEDNIAQKGQKELNLSREGDFPSCKDIDEVLKLNGQTSSVSESATLSLEAKVANFIQNGELDAVEDSEFGITYDRYANEVERTLEAFSHQKQKGFSLSSSSDAETLNGDICQSIQNAADRVFENRNSSTEVQDHATDLTVESAAEQAEVERLKFFLRQKELELTQLKQQVEKEKIALSVLQATAETEIIKAQNLISEKETELRAAEESLSGLKEVEVQYSGEGKTVELAGSFNGWHHKIRMEPYSSSTTHSIGSRASQLWGAVLWLYPGVYEIKLVIDGHWRTDPQREICTRNGMSNNILRVDS